MHEGFAIGVDMGGTGIRVELFDAHDERLAKTAFPTQGGGPELPARLARAASDLIAEAGVEARNASAVGVAIAAMIDEEHRKSCSPNADFDLRAIGEGLASVFPAAHLVFLNDADAALVGEMHFGAAQGKNDVFLITLGTGVGGALAANGRLVRGGHGLAGEIGHMQVVTSGGRACGCGNTGCLERYVSGTGIALTTQENLEVFKGTTSLATLKPITGVDVFDAARAGDELAGSVIDSFVEMLAFGMRQFALVTDPELFLIGGGMSGAADVFLEPLRKAYRTQALPLFAKVPIDIAALGNEAGCLGAAYFAQMDARRR